MAAPPPHAGDSYSSTHSRSQRHALAALTSGKTGNHRTGGCVRLGLNSERARKMSSPPGFAPRTFQPMASDYTDYAIPTASEEMQPLIN